MYLNFRLYGPKFRYILFDAILAEFSIDERKVKRADWLLKDKGRRHVRQQFQKVVRNESDLQAFCSLETGLVL